MEASIILIVIRCQPVGPVTYCLVLLYPNSIKGLKPVEYYLPLGRISFGQPT